MNNGWVLPEDVLRDAPTYALRNAELADLELRLPGAYAPLTGFMTRADLVAVGRRGRLADGTPFPTLFYLTCPRATAACSRLESAGLMKEMAERLAADPELAARYRAAHEDYLARREAIGEVPEIAGISAGGMPGRVKCLHVHLGHALGAGPGVNPFGDETLALVEKWWAAGPCVDVPAAG